MNIMDKVTEGDLKEAPPVFEVGDTVDVHVRIVEGDKERVQVFTGVVIGRRGRGVNETFTVRRIVAGQGVERVFPVHSPRVVDVKVRRKGVTRRAKLHFLRKRIGKATRLKERIIRKKRAGDAALDTPRPSGSTPDPTPDKDQADNKDEA